MISLTPSQKIRYEMRNNTESIIKKFDIDRNKFHEAGKNDYETIIRRLYFTFCD